LRSIGSGVYFFGEERIIKAPPVTQITGSILPSEDNIRLILIDWAVKDRTLRDPSQKSNLYERVQKAFDQICSPRKMGEVYSLDSNGEYFIEFFDEHGIPYTFDGLSSGERSVLNFLVRYHHRHMSHAIVLIDEIETHLHPDWQRRVLRYLRRTGDNNQFIITTHSPAILMSVDADDMILLGYLDQAQQAIPVIEGSSNE
jgi:predicted ATP-dependent endonuclease of OLD family